MKYKLFFVFVLIILLTIASANAQPALFNQYQSNTLYNNPAFTGISEQPSFTAYFGQHIIEKDVYNPYFGFYPSGAEYSGYNSAISYQQYWDKIKGSFGINVTSMYYHFEDFNHINTEGINLSYSPTIKITNNLYFKPAIEVGYYFEKYTSPYTNNTYQGIDTFIIFKDTIHEKIYKYSEPMHNYFNNYFNFNSGILFYSANFHIGFSINHINRPQSYAFTDPQNTNPNTPLELLGVFYQSKAIVPYSFTFNLGFNINSNDSAKTLTISPHLYIEDDYYWGYSLIGSNFKYKKILLGLDLCEYDWENVGLLTTLGYQFKHLKISYSYTYDLTYVNISNVGSIRNSLNSIQLIYSLPKKEHSTPPVYTSIY